MKTLLLAAAVLVAGAVLLASTAQEALAQPKERTGEEIVKAQCSKCHAEGLHGAPRIDDRAAWSQRMKNGLDAAVRSAIKGHGAMPARGGLADLTDTELRSAILYLFNPAGVPPRPAATAAAGPNQKTVGGADIFLGVSAKGGDVYHVTITLHEAGTPKVIGDARVEASVTNPVMGTESKKLERETANGVVSYGADFRMSGKEAHTITVQVRKPRAAPIEAKFEFRG